ncbi:MAG: NUDIX domain-containing protein [Candidatus ainarchaeum sp.]|nr:NUDIX domain-containing protein [Candidatus ainarchaeum sp.]
MREKSAGAVVFRPGKRGPSYLLLRHPQGHWSFPKGRIAPGETELRAAAREIFEETGIRPAWFAPGVKKRIRYRVTREGKQKEKSVVFFLARMRAGRARLSREHVECSWLPFDEALERVTHANSRRVLRSMDAELRKLRGGRLGLRPASRRGPSGR